MKTTTGLLALLAGLIIAVPPTHAQKTYKWVDDQGNITYQDRPPPTGVQVVDEYGEEAKAARVDPNQLAAQNSPVVLYSVPVCDACDLIRGLLEKTGIPYAEKNAEKDNEVQQELRDKVGQLAVPVLLVGNKPITGYSGSIIRAELTSAGYDLSANASGATPAATPAAPAETPLTADEAEALAAEAAEELVADNADENLEIAETVDLEGVEDLEEIPEEERIKTPYNP